MEAHFVRNALYLLGSKEGSDSGEEDGDSLGTELGSTLGTSVGMLNRRKRSQNCTDSYTKDTTSGAWWTVLATTQRVCQVFCWSRLASWYTGAELLATAQLSAYICDSSRGRDSLQ